MAGSLKRRMQGAVDAVRDIDRELVDRRASDLFMLERAEPLVRVADDIGYDVIRINERDGANIAQRVRAVVADQARLGIRVDATGLDAITDPVSRMICTRQVPVIERLHMLAAVMRGVELGLRDLVTLQDAPPARQGGAKKVGKAAPTAHPSEQDVHAGTSNVSTEVREVLDQAKEPPKRVSQISRTSNGRMPITPDSEEI